MGHRGMIHAAKVLAVTAIDLFEDDRVRDAIRVEFRQKTQGSNYRPRIPEGPPAIPGP